MTQRRPPPGGPARFGADWLQQREPFDAAARHGADKRLALSASLSTLRPPASTPWRVLDLACGTGANLRWLAPRLGGRQEWLVVDHDAALLRRWPMALGLPRAGADDLLNFDGIGFNASVVRRRLDLVQDLETLPWQAAHLVTASALLDLVSAAWQQRLVAACARSRTAMLFALTVDGRHHWQPADPLDTVVGALFATHQTRDKGFGPALGPRAGAALVRELRAAGYRVRCARSDWSLQGREDAPALALQRALIDGMAAAACEQDAGAGASVQRWRQRRHDCAARARLLVGHVDVLALPG